MPKKSSKSTAGSPAVVQGAAADATAGQVLATSSVAALTTTAVAALATSAVLALTTDQVGALTTSDVAAIDTTAVKALGSESEKTGKARAATAKAKEEVVDTWPKHGTVFNHSEVSLVEPITCKFLYPRASVSVDLHSPEQLQAVQDNLTELARLHNLGPDDLTLTV